MTNSSSSLAIAAASALLAFSAPLDSAAQWTDYVSYSGCSLSAVAADMPVCGNSYGLFYYDAAEGLLGKLTKVNHLSSTGISALGSDGAYLAVGYSDGDLDIVDMANLTTVNIPELRLSETYTAKSINAITASDGMLYCAFGSGVVEVNTSKNEVRSAWRITSSGVSATSVCVAGGRIYVGSASGLYSASLASHVLEDYSQWTLNSQVSGGVVALAEFGGKAYAAVGSLGGNCSIVRVGTDEAVEVLSASGFRGFASSNSKLAVVSSASVAVYDSKLSEVATVGVVKSSDGAAVVSSPAYRSASFLSDGSLAIADYNSGLVVSSLQGVGRVWKPNGPATADNSDILAVGGDFYALGPGRNSSFNNANNVARFSVLSNGEWTSVSRGSYSAGMDPIFLAQNPSTGDVYLSTWGSGVFRLEDHAFAERYYMDNTPMLPAYSNVVRTDAIVVDKDQNLYVVNCSVDNGLMVRTKDGEWYSYDYGIGNSTHSCNAILATSNGNIWVATSRMGTPSLFVFNINGTPETDDDDVFMSTRSSFEAYSQCVGTFSLTDASSGESLGSYATALAVSSDGTVWVGTTAGILVTKDNSSALKNGSITLNRIKVPRNDGTNLADYLLDGQYIYDIKVDGADRKWIATDNGVYLVSSDGTETIHHFLATNSPLPVNDVKGVEIRPTDGEVFFSTASGLVSYHGDAIAPASKLENIKIYPNPASPSAAPGYVSMTGFEDGSRILITDVAGHSIYRTTSLGGLARWDFHREKGGRVASGVYIVWAINSEGENKAVGKIMVVE